MQNDAVMDLLLKNWIMNSAYFYGLIEFQDDNFNQDRQPCLEKSHVRMVRWGW